MKNPAASSASLKRIFLIRHYEPAVDRTGFFNAAEAHNFLDAYDAAALVNTPFVRPPGLPENPEKVYCSSLNRAKQTAMLLFGKDIQLIEDTRFNEFQRKIFKLPLFRFPIWVWLTGARLLWLAGLNSRGIETFEAARKRAKICAEHLAELAEKETPVILVAHGFLNAFIRKALKKTGWNVVRHDGNHYLGVTELVK